MPRVNDHGWRRLVAPTLLRREVAAGWGPLVTALLRINAYLWNIQFRTCPESKSCIRLTHFEDFRHGRSLDIYDQIWWQVFLRRQKLIGISPSPKTLWNLPHFLHSHRPGPGCLTSLHSRPSRVCGASSRRGSEWCQSFLTGFILPSWRSPSCWCFWIWSTPNGKVDALLPDHSMQGQEETTISAQQLEEVLKSVQGWAV